MSTAEDALKIMLSTLDAGHALVKVNSLSGQILRTQGHDVTEVATEVIWKEISEELQG